jgi:hypothetical protein
MTITKIKQIESEFDDIYRITCENGLILDISESSKPVIGSSIEYFINLESESLKNRGYNINTDGYTIMNGIIYNNNTIGVLVSFGGLLGNIPNDLLIKNLLTDTISIIYRLQS